MLISIKLSLPFLLLVATSYSIANAPSAQNWENINVYAMKGALKTPLQTDSPTSFQVVSNYLFPFMRDVGSETSNPTPTPSSNTSNTGNNWTIISGKWMPTANGVQAGDNSSGVLNSMVRPITFNSTDLDITTSFTIRTLDRNVTNYISIVYSWKDPQNYKFAGITINKDGTFADFGTLTNGTLSWDPSWPGSSIDLDWIPGDPIRMTLSLGDNSRELDLNGIGSLQEDSVDENESGYIGLSYGRVQDAVFHQFDIRENTE
jgi:hypothetical protein